MPLFSGKNNIGRNIAALVHEGKDQDQAVAIALDVARRRAEKKDGGRVLDNIRAAEKDVDRTPTEAERKAGNYKKGHIAIHGMDITIENPKGSKRSGEDKSGKAWSVKMGADYGYIRGSEAKDGDHVDCYVGPSSASEKVWVIDQVDAETGKYDEAKVCLGYKSEQDAVDTYVKAFSDGKGKDRIGDITEMSLARFKDWLESGDTTKPKGEIKARRAAGGRVGYASGGTPYIDYSAGRGGSPLDRARIKYGFAHDVSGKNRRLPNPGNIPQYHVTFDKNGWYLERPLSVQAPHAMAYNPESVALARIGFEGDPLSPEELKYGTEAFKWMNEQTGLKPEQWNTHPGYGPRATKTGKQPTEGNWLEKVRAAAMGQPVTHDVSLVAENRDILPTTSPAAASGVTPVSERGITAGIPKPTELAQASPTPTLTPKPTEGGTLTPVPPPGTLPEVKPPGMTASVVPAPMVPEPIKPYDPAQYPATAAAAAGSQALASVPPVAAAGGQGMPGPIFSALGSILGGMGQEKAPKPMELNPVPLVSNSNALKLAESANPFAPKKDRAGESMALAGLFGEEPRMFAEGGRADSDLMRHLRDVPQTRDDPFVRPSAPGTENLSFDRNTITPQEAIQDQANVEARRRGRFSYPGTFAEGGVVEADAPQEPWVENMYDYAESLPPGIMKGGAKTGAALADIANVALIRPARHGWAGMQNYLSNYGKQVPDADSFDQGQQKLALGKLGGESAAILSGLTPAGSLLAKALTKPRPSLAQSYRVGRDAKSRSGQFFAGDEKSAIPGLIVSEAAGRGSKGSTGAAGRPQGPGADPGAVQEHQGLPQGQAELGSPGGARDPYAPIPGIPKYAQIPGYGAVEARPIPWIVDSAESYMRGFGQPHLLPDKFESFDPSRAKLYADEFERMRHDPTDPEVRRAYEAMADETIAQYRALKDQGAEFRFNQPGQDPYAASPAMGYPELRDQRKLAVFPTAEGFGTLTKDEVANNPLLKMTSEKFGDQPATVNDLFRAMHDSYGHFGFGNPFFRAPGEDRAYIIHSGMYGPEAVRAAASELRGQNSWLNYGPYGEKNRTASTPDTVFADQKTGLMPDWVVNAGTPRGKGLKLFSNDNSATPAGIAIAESLNKDPLSNYYTPEQRIPYERDITGNIKDAGRPSNQVEPQVSLGPDQDAVLAHFYRDMKDNYGFNNPYMPHVANEAGEFPLEAYDKGGLNKKWKDKVRKTGELYANDESGLPGTLLATSGQDPVRFTRPTPLRVVYSPGRKSGSYDMEWYPKGSQGNIPEGLKDGMSINEIRTKFGDVVADAVAANAGDPHRLAPHARTIDGIEALPQLDTQALSDAAARADKANARSGIPYRTGQPLTANAYHGMSGELEGGKFRPPDGVSGNWSNADYPVPQDGVWSTTSRESAHKYADVASDRKGDLGSPAIVPTTYEFQNPYVLNGRQFHRDGFAPETFPDLGLVAQAGYDGVVIPRVDTESFRGPKHYDFAALKPGTVKSKLTGEVLYSNSDEVMPLGMGIASGADSDVGGMTLGSPSIISSRPPRQRNLGELVDKPYGKANEIYANSDDSFSAGISIADAKMKNLTKLAGDDAPLGPLSEDAYWEHHDDIAERLRKKWERDVDPDVRDQFKKSINDAVNNAYYEQSVNDWIRDAERVLGREFEVVRINPFFKERGQ